MNNINSCLKWSNGSKYEKSKKYEKEKYLNNDSDNDNKNIQIDTMLEKSIYLDNLRESSQDLKLNNKKEESNKKYLEREYISNTNLNPFLKETDYINDLMNRDKFLIPKDSNIN